MSVKPSICDLFAQFQENHKNELIQLLQPDETPLKEVHKKCETPEKNMIFLGKFLNFYIKKVIACSKHRPVDMKNVFSEKYVYVFPFKISRSLNHQVDIYEFYNETFQKNIIVFIETYFGPFNYEKIVRLFLSNIHQHKLNSAHGRKGNPLTIKKLQMFENNFQMFEKIFKLYRRRSEKPIIVPSDEKSILNLWENNLDELYSLLDPIYYTKNSQQYLERFKKYILFFVHSLNRRQSYGIGFIDDYLYEGVKSIKTYSRCFEDPISLKYEIALMATLRIRQYYIEPLFCNDGFVLEDSFLVEIKNYIAGIPNIRTAITDLEIETKYFKDSFDLYVNGSVYMLTFSKSMNFLIFPKFCKLAVKAAMLQQPGSRIRNLVIYNSNLGETITMKMPENLVDINKYINDHANLLYV